MTARLIAPVIPRPAGLAGRGRPARPGTIHRLPAASVPEIPAAPDDVPVVSGAVSDGTRRAYGTYWNRVVEHWGDRRLDEPTPSDIRNLMTLVKAGAVQRRNSRGGRSSQEHLVGALRCPYARAEDDGHINQRDNPARKVAKPRRLPSTRRAVADTRLAEINQVAAATSDDPEPDTLILRPHTETACRRGGALALMPEDLAPEHCLILLREKGSTMRWQPVSPTLMSHLITHGETRGGLESGQRLLRYADGRPITSRRYDYLWRRLGDHLPWVATQQVSTHWIRHTILTWVNGTSASPSRKPTRDTKTTAEAGEPWLPISARASPRPQRRLPP